MFVGTIFCRNFTCFVVLVRSSFGLCRSGIPLRIAWLEWQEAMGSCALARGAATHWHGAAFLPPVGHAPQVSRHLEHECADT